MPGEPRATHPICCPSVMCLKAPTPSTMVGDPTTGSQSTFTVIARRYTFTLLTGERQGKSTDFGAGCLESNPILSRTNCRTLVNLPCYASVSSSRKYG